MKTLNEAKWFIDDYFHFVNSQVIEMHDSDFDSDTEETDKLFVSKEKCTQNIKVMKILKWIYLLKGALLLGIK